MDALIPSPHLIAFEKLTISGLEMMIEAKTTRTVVHCPECQQSTQKVHSSYLRYPRDLPTAGLSVRLLLHTRKFFCENQHWLLSHHLLLTTARMRGKIRTRNRTIESASN